MSRSMCCYSFLTNATEGTYHLGAYSFQEDRQLGLSAGCTIFNECFQRVRERTFQTNLDGEQSDAKALTSISTT